MPSTIQCHQVVLLIVGDLQSRLLNVFTANTVFLLIGQTVELKNIEL